MIELQESTIILCPRLLREHFHQHLFKHEVYWLKSCRTTGNSMFAKEHLNTLPDLSFATPFDCYQLR